MIIKIVFTNFAVRLERAHWPLSNTAMGRSNLWPTIGSQFNYRPKSIWPLAQMAPCLRFSSYSPSILNMFPYKWLAPLFARLSNRHSSIWPSGRLIHLPLHQMTVLDIFHCPPVVRSLFLTVLSIAHLFLVLFVHRRRVLSRFTHFLSFTFFY